MSFHVGQKVVCVDDSNFLGRYGEIVPTKGHVYTIAEFFTVAAGECVRLVEIKNKPHRYLEGFDECGFLVRRFRPIQERSTGTGMAILRSLLNPTPEAVRDLCGND